MVSLQASEFTDVPSKTSTFGFRMWDDYGSSWTGGFNRSQIPSNDLDLLAMAVRQAQLDESILAMLVATADCKNSIFINGKEYIWEVIAPILASGGMEAKDSTSIETPVTPTVDAPLISPTPSGIDPL